jgi:hydrogenase 3 maturation protease
MKPMSSDWSNSLNQTLTALRKRKPPRTVVVGIGHELRGDDAAGVMVARKLQSKLSGLGDFLVVDGGHAPENYTGVLRRFAPDLVILVDSAQMDEPAGTVRWLAWQETGGLSASTHTMPPYVIARYLRAETGCEAALIGIQPEQTAIGADLSPAVKNAVDQVVNGLAQILIH